MVIVSKFSEVIKIGRIVLFSKYFYVFGMYDLLGVELVGVFKNVIVLGFGIFKGRGFGKNI